MEEKNKKNSETEKRVEKPKYHSSRADDDLIKSQRKNLRAYRKNKKLF